MKIWIISISHLETEFKNTICNRCTSNTKWRCNSNSNSKQLHRIEWALQLRDKLKSMLKLLFNREWCLVCLPWARIPVRRLSDIINRPVNWSATSEFTRCVWIKKSWITLSLLPWSVKNWTTSFNMHILIIRQVSVSLNRSIPIKLELNSLKLSENSLSSFLKEFHNSKKVSWSKSRTVKVLDSLKRF